ncbi:unnamed protein product [Rangifer tarandus platyrhynchus]|uniref:Uncharacterized protein n=2 Tax=Rangifer tarandus platyrhynchus TaxID=3082113 RepID=A0ABN8YKH2_RANTA|nr:unnamed protein product [Rangifer tarandus platyrhynchus]CAI9697025.1 unnamed protein product [Rangifer tarandus platyrhynchus]
MQDSAARWRWRQTRRYVMRSYYVLGTAAETHLLAMGGFLPASPDDRGLAGPECINAQQLSSQPSEEEKEP